MTLAIDMTDERDLSSEVCHELLVKKQGNVTYFSVHAAVKIHLPAVHITNKMKHLSYKSGCAM